MLEYQIKLVIIALVCLIIPPIFLVRSAQKNNQDPSHALLKGLLVGLASLFVMALVMDNGEQLIPNRHHYLPSK